MKPMKFFNSFWFHQTNTAINNIFEILGLFFDVFSEKWIFSELQKKYRLHDDLKLYEKSLLCTEIRSNLKTTSTLGGCNFCRIFLSSRMFTFVPVSFRSLVLDQSLSRHRKGWLTVGLTSRTGDGQLKQAPSFVRISCALIRLTIRYLSRLILFFVDLFWSGIRCDNKTTTTTEC